MSSSQSSEVQPGEQIGRYTVVRRLAVGGMAEIYLARHEGLKGFSKLVVIKRVLPGLQHTEKFVAMFLDEGRLAARLSHPSIAQTFELGEHEGSFHIVMEYVPGESLNRLVKRAALDGKPVPLGAQLRVAMQVLEALDYAHELKGDHGDWLKVVHRDVSPTNVIVTYHGGVKLLDFGIARASIHEHHTQIGTVKGKGGYMSPEQALAVPVDHRTDIYAVGSLLYLLTTGAGPFDGQDDVFAMMRAAVEARFPKPSARAAGIPPQLEAIILKAMSQRADDRYPTAGVMLAELEAFAASQRLFPSARELTIYMRQLFPERVELARSFDQLPDEAVVAKLAESFSRVDSAEIISTPTRLARRPVSKPDERPVVEEPATIGRAVPLPLPAKQGRASTRTVPLGAQLEATTQVPSMQRGLAAQGAIPDEPAAERKTQQQAAMLFFSDEPEEKTAAAAPVTGPERTVSAEQLFTALSTGDDGAADGGSTVAGPTPGRTRSLTHMASVGDLVANNPWAFVVAGLAAVLLGVAVLWALGGN